MRWIFLVLLCVVGLEASANCAPPVQKIVSTIPANGQTDVALDARLHVFGSGLEFESVLLNGVRLRRLSREDGLALDLEPQTDYRLVFTFTSEWCDSGCSEPHVVEFRTGTGQAGEISAPVLTGHEDQGWRPYEGMGECAVQTQQDCMDTGEAGYMRLESAEPASGYLVRWKTESGYLFQSSGECGGPVGVWYRDFVEEPCFSVRAIGVNGEVSEATNYCVESSAPVASGGGCAMGGGVAGLWALLALGLYRRRRCELF